MEITKEVTDVLENLRNRFGDDLVQEAYLFAMEYEGEVTNLKGFLGTKLNHLESNERHVERNRRRLEVEAGLTTAEQETAPDPLDLLVAEEALVETLKELSDLNRATFLKYWAEGMSIEDIAKEYDQHPEVARVRMQRAKKQFKDLFHDKIYGDTTKEGVRMSQTEMETKHREDFLRRARAIDMRNARIREAAECEARGEEWTLRSHV